MNAAQFQSWLNARLQVADRVRIDGNIGPVTQAAVVKVFTQTRPDRVSDAQLTDLAHRLGGTLVQIKAVARVESGGSGWFRDGLPKILWERHWFWRLTEGKFGLSWFSNPKAGDYTNDSNSNQRSDSWDKLLQALTTRDILDAFASASWGMFQVMGAHAEKLGYANSLEMAYSTVNSELGHYEMLVRYIEKFGLKEAFCRLSTNPDNNVGFARGYNGPNFKKFDYHNKLAQAIRNLS